MNNQQSNYTFTPHDLRIGNVVNNYGGRRTIVDDTHLNWLFQYTNDFNESFSPIPITVEMLVEELGYEKRGIAYITYNRNRDTRLSIIVLHTGKMMFCVYGQGITEFTYLHELQNLHYDFTREMLTLKSKEK